MNIFWKNITASVIFSIMGAATVNAAGNGSTPKGKPFVAIDNQLVEVQGAVSSLEEQMELLVARVTTVEERVDADAAAIASLQAQNNALEILVNNNIADIQAINDKIVLLEQENAALLVSITGNTGDIEALQEQVAANELAISNFQLALIQVETNAISLTEGLQEQIDHNESLIVLLNAEIDTLSDAIALKQDLINGICPGGTAVTEVLPDGSVVCGGAGGGSTGQLQRFSILKWSGDMAPGATIQDFAQCPAGNHCRGRWIPTRYSHKCQKRACTHGK